MKVLNVIAAKWMLVVAFTLIGLIAAIGYSLLQPQTYVATVRTYIATGTSDMLEAYQGNQAARASIQTFAVLATDPTVAQRAIDRSGVDISLPQFLSEISVSVPPQTVILDVSVQNSTSADAERLSTALAQELVGTVTALQEPTSGGPGALRLVVVDPNTQGAVREQLIDPILLGIGAVGGALAGSLIALILHRRRGGMSDVEGFDTVPDGPTTGDIEVTINRPSSAMRSQHQPLVKPAPTQPPLAEQVTTHQPLVEPAPSEARRRVEATRPPLVEPAPTHQPLVEPAPSEARRRVEATRPPLVEPAPSETGSRPPLVEPAPSEARRRVETTPRHATYTARHTLSRHSATRHGGGFAGPGRSI
ncbi:MULTISPECIES: YveK family protein [Gordonia]|uniref:YveK family protein n=1 Tax=Gordonia TaxID=2053 RepID=UPI00071CF77F|nr:MULTISPECIES: capsular biosynthesis protein [unclassified Gordonia (in: high G+C Gram-positive bacteria)]KSU53910.1 capsular biosynthesis protein [Gordonia sp. SGD-V-85]SCC55539.1 Capsular polysaccharide biosynthesis protein [Gordonia sp. v-85]